MRNIGRDGDKGPVQRQVIFIAVKFIVDDDVSRLSARGLLKGELIDSVSAPSK